MGRNELHDEMLEAFLAIEAQDAHVLTRRDYLSGLMKDAVSASVRFQRKTTGATGVTETQDQSAKVFISTRSVPDPLMSDAEFLYQKRREQDRAERLGVKPRLDIGRVSADENSMSRIGALCFIRPPRRQEHHEAAAEWFKALYEARYGVGSPAIDASRPIVDNSPIAHDSGMAARIDRTWRLQQVEKHDKAMFDRLVALLVLCIPVSDYAPKASSGRSNDRRVRQLVNEALSDLDRLSALWGLSRKAA